DGRSHRGRSRRGVETAPTDAVDPRSPAGALREGEASPLVTWTGPRQQPPPRERDWSETPARGTSSRGHSTAARQTPKVEYESVSAVTPSTERRLVAD